MFVWIPNVATYILAVMLIGSRQLGLLILMHDGAHGMLCRRRKLNNFLSQWCCAFPALADTNVYRRYHLQHHARTLRDDDPDIVLTGHYPVTRASLRRKLWRDISGQTGFNQRRAQFSAALGPADKPLIERVRRMARGMRGPLVVNVSLCAFLTVLGYWYLYPMLWVVPLLTWQQLVLRCAQYCRARGRVGPERSF